MRKSTRRTGKTSLFRLCPRCGRNIPLTRSVHGLCVLARLRWVFVILALAGIGLAIWSGWLVPLVRNMNAQTPIYPSHTAPPIMPPPEQPQPEQNTTAQLNRNGGLNTDAPNPKQGFIRGKKTSLRAKPDNKSKRMATLPTNTRVTVLPDSTNKWLHIETETGKTGWVSSKFVTILQ